ncbi:glycosyltransferase family 2 protein [Hymenobacter persicinus]|uniref:Glycosyltransferase family 2 protein n=1 Tax=Hymenobacter persicinus TaxID=2025506 RepID=A0A4V1ZA89_9BACT|nr:glycosyltransferase family 2 protein [Hymenobacter persicinus]RYU75794.1 glycosyltransferase family 2 protein [Hymenobacter persicinus]
MQVSVIIINYNTFQLTSEAVESIIKHTKGVSYEIIVVDNASTECDPGLFAERFPSIKLVRNPDNSGFAKGNNLGIRHSSGDTILLFNSDAACLNDAITLTYEALQAEKDLGLTTARLEYPDGRVQHSCGRFPSIGLQLVELLRLQKVMTAEQRANILQGAFFTYDKPLYPDWVWGTYYHLKREVIEKMPGQQLADDFFMYAEDLQWSYTVRKLGYTIKYVPEARVMHHFSQSTKKEKRLNQGNMILQNEDIFLNREYGWATTKAYYLAKMANFFLLRGNPEHRQLMLQQYGKLLRGKPL